MYICSYFSDSAIERYHNCDVYIDEADIPTQNTYCYYDRLRGNRFYCKTWGCDAPDCPPDQQITRERDCPYCPSKSDWFLNIRFIVQLFV